MLDIKINWTRLYYKHNMESFLLLATPNWYDYDVEHTTNEEFFTVSNLNQIYKTALLAAFIGGGLKIGYQVNIEGGA